MGNAKFHTLFIILQSETGEQTLFFMQKRLRLRIFHAILMNKRISKNKNKNKNCGLFSLYDIHHNKKPRFIGVLLFDCVPFSTSLYADGYRSEEHSVPIGRGTLRVGCIGEIPGSRRR